MITTAERFADCRVALRREILGQPHRDLARPGDLPRTFLRKQVGNLEFEIVSDRLLYVLDRNLPVNGANEILQRGLGEIEIDLAAVE
ncbi:hypothetical protein D3C72_2440320 [compost metagenome]